MNAEAITGHLDRLLTGAADEATRHHWERYLRGTAAFRGVPMDRIRRTVRTLWDAHGLATEPIDDLLTLAVRWFHLTPSEDKLAAVLLVAEHLAPRLEDRHHDALAEPFRRGDVADWNVCDWYATKAVHAYLTTGDLRGRAGPITAWSGSADLWQRRAAVVSFVRIAAAPSAIDPDLIESLLTACAANLGSPDRFAHTGPGWLLRELSRTAPDRVSRFVSEHPELSPEARKMANARLRPGPYRRR